MPSVPHAGTNLRVRVVTDIDSATASAWAELEERALDANAYLSPHFVLPALKYLRAGAAPAIVVLVETADHVARELVGVGVFEHSGPTLRFPLPHLKTFRSRHSFVSGLLVDKAFAPATVSAFLGFFLSGGSRWHGVEFSAFPLEGPLNLLLQQAAAHDGVPWFEYRREPRSMLVPAAAGDAYLAQRLPHERRKDLQRRLRRLQEQGAVDWRVSTGAGISDEQVECFLDLEHRGWKGRDGTSLRSCKTDAAFFREMVAGFRQRGKIVFTELVLAGRPIAATTNLISGNAGFAFKLGWDPEFAKVAPGMLSEVELIRHAPRVFQGLEYLDSGAAPGSFMDELWLERRELVSGAFALTSLGRLALALSQRAAAFKRSLATHKAR